MNTRKAYATEWPITMTRAPEGGATVALADGRSVELDAFRVDCRELALELRREAMDEALAATVAALCRMSGAAVRLLRAAFARKAGAAVHGI